MSPTTTGYDEMNRGFDQDTIERVARMYRSNGDASRALGITLRSFNRLCTKFGIETPYAKRRRQTAPIRVEPPVKEIGPN